MNDQHGYEAMFSGIIGQDYDMLRLICPLATEMSRLVGETVGDYCKTLNEADSIQLLELGGGTGITTLAVLSADSRLTVVSVDNEIKMQQQAKNHLKKWMEEGRLQFSAEDALTALKQQGTQSVDLVATAYTLHNFENNYRAEVIGEIHRVLKPGGQFINGDRYGLDDVTAHTRIIQQEVAGYFKVLIEQQRLDLLEHWIIHLFNDESENHVMRESKAIQQLIQAGFNDVALSHRMEVNALVKAVK